MVPPKENRPSDPALVLDDLADDPPTGKYAPVSPRKAAQVTGRRGVAERETVPAAGEAVETPTPLRPPQGPTGGGARRSASSDAQRAAGRPTAPAAARTKRGVPDPPAVPRDDDGLFGPLHAPSDRPTQEVPADGPPRPGEKIAPPPPRMPTLGPEPDFAFGIEPPLRGPRSERPIERETPSQLKAMTEDLSWDLRPRTGRSEAPAQPSATTPASLALDADAGDAHALVRRASLPPTPSSDDPKREMSERFALGDFSGALAIAETMTENQRNDVEVDRVASECRARLEQMYVARLGAKGQVPVMAVPRAELKWLSLDHRAGFVLSLVDGSSSVEEIIDVSGMPALEVLRTLFDLVSQRVIELRAKRK